MEAHDTLFYQKPDTIDSPVYEKPNAYENVPEIVPEDGYETTAIANVTEETDGSARSEAVHDQPSPSKVLLSQVAAVAQTVTMPAEEPSWTSPVQSPSVSDARTDSNRSHSNDSSIQRLQESLRKKSKADMVLLQLRKRSLLQPQEHVIYRGDNPKDLAYRKEQSHSYTWGFQNVLFRGSGDSSREDRHHHGGESEEGKVAEARRAFEKEIALTWGDFEKCTTCSSELRNTAKTHLLFVYEYVFEGFRVRWRRTSLLSHDLVCEFRRHAEEGDWRQAAVFDSHGMGYLMRLGDLVVDRQALGLMCRPDQFEALLVLTCCTLIDLMREVVQKAVGMSGGGGVIGSS